MVLGRLPHLHPLDAEVRSQLMKQRRHSTVADNIEKVRVATMALDNQHYIERLKGVGEEYDENDIMLSGRPLHNRLDADLVSQLMKQMRRSAVAHNDKNARVASLVAENHDFDSHHWLRKLCQMLDVPHESEDEKGIDEKEGNITFHPPGWHWKTLD